MHEMSLCEGVRQVIEDYAQSAEFDAVRKVRVEIGRFAGVEKDAFVFAFDVVMRGSVAEGAELELIDVPGRATCFDCSKDVEIMERLDPCPDCGGGRLLPSGGTEMKIKDLEVI